MNSAESPCPTALPAGGVAVYVCAPPYAIQKLELPLAHHRSRAVSYGSDDVGKN